MLTIEIHVNSEIASLYSIYTYIEKFGVDFQEFLVQFCTGTVRNDELNIKKKNGYNLRTRLNRVHVCINFFLLFSCSTSVVEAGIEVVTKHPYVVGNYSTGTINIFLT